MSLDFGWGGRRTIPLDSFDLRRLESGLTTGEELGIEADCAGVAE